MHTQIINGREVLTVPTVIGYKHYDLEKREVVGEVIESTYRRKDGTMYIIRRSRTEREKAAMLNSCLSDWGYQYEQTTKKPRWQTELRRDTSLYIFISRLYHVSTKIRNGEFKNGK